MVDLAHVGDRGDHALDAHVVVVLIPKEGGDCRRIGLPEVAWKVIKGVFGGRQG